MTPNHQRLYPRYAHEAAVTLHVGARPVQGRTQNVSRGGLCADLADPLTVGAELEVDLQLIFENEETSEPLRIPARVAWCTSVDEAHQVGLSFKPMTAELAKYLGVFLRYLGWDERGAGDKPHRSEVPAKRRAATVDERFG